MAAPYMSENTQETTTTTQQAQPVQSAQPVQHTVETKTIVVPQPVAVPQASQPDNVSVEVQAPELPAAPITDVMQNTQLNMLLGFLLVAIVLLAVPAWFVASRR